MDKHTSSTVSWFSAIGLFAVLLALGGCSASSTGGDVGGLGSRLTASCLPEGTPPPAGAWVCPEARELECSAGGADVDTLYVKESNTLSCAGSVSVSESGPFGVGTHTVTVHDANGADVCSAELEVVDSQPPVLTAHDSLLWPPNHKFHDLSVSDCVSAVDSCDGQLQGEFIWASSDEPVDDLGDGHHQPDILFGDCQHVSLRAERQGPKDGRVYKLGVRVTDAAGHTAESTCTVIVDHDQRGVTGADSGESYRITLDGTGGALDCGRAVNDQDAGEPMDEQAGTGGGDTAGVGSAGVGSLAGTGAAGMTAADGGGPF